MILKEKDGETPSGKYEKAGYEAEKQMAYYLRRAFAESPDVFVLNDLRFVRNEEVAQIDHLVLHRYGLVLVESKSVTGSIEVNKQLEFARVYAGKRSGMMSPISQVQMQKTLLQSLLNDHREELREKVLLGMRQPSFLDERFQTLVAVSDSGEIKRKGCDPAELVKADQVAGVITARIAARDRTRGVGGAVRSILADKKTRKQMEEDRGPLTGVSKRWV